MTRAGGQAGWPGPWPLPTRPVERREAVRKQPEIPPRKGDTRGTFRAGMWQWEAQPPPELCDAHECRPGPQGRPNRPPSTIPPGVGRRRRPIDGANNRLDRPLRGGAGRASSEAGSRAKDDQAGKQDERMRHHTGGLTCGFRARGRIRTDDLPITSRTLTLQPDPLRTILAAQERDRFRLMPSRSAWYQRLGCQRGCHPSSAGSSLLALASALAIRRPGVSAPARRSRCPLVGLANDRVTRGGW
jgi:hypothetical protein